jgi:23S rRNA (cytidine1920-2'-O)/16S rRNA (cytidine1409-2'-O)-methyltransferase
MKKRIDILLVERGLAETRTKAQALVMAGQVSSDGKRLDKPGLAIEDTADIHLKQQPRYVSRAGEKLASVADQLHLDFKGKVVLDVGSSTGGFTDYALQNGASKVYCVDVGTAQLAYKLRQDSRVVVMEQTDIRDTKLPEKADIAVMDVSFISLRKVLESTSNLVKPGYPIVAMAKPQFEAGRLLADKYRGVIPMGSERDGVLDELKSWMGQQFDILAEANSGLSGAEGNVERFYLICTH